MSEQIAGVIDSIYTKEIQIKNGPRTGQTTQIYHATINGHDVNLGFETKLSQGENVVLNVEHKYGGYQLLQGAPSGQPTSVPAAGIGTAVAAPRNPAARAAFPVDIDSTGTSICRQSSLNRAVELVSLMVAESIVVMKTEQEYLDKVFEIAYQFTDFTTGQREVKQANVQAAYNEE